MAPEIECFRSISSWSKSVVVVPSSIRPSRVVAPALNRSCDTESFSGVVMADKDDVSNLRARIDLHMDVLAWGVSKWDVDDKLKRGNEVVAAQASCL